MPLDFRSRTFSQFVDPDEHRTIREDLPTVLEVKKWGEAVRLVQEALLERTKRQRLEGIEKLREALHTSRATADAVYRFIQFFLRHSIRLHTKQDAIDDLVADVMLLWGKGTDTQRKVLRERLEAIRQQATDYHRKGLRDDALSGVLPTFSGCGTTVELRGIFEKELMFAERASDFTAEAAPSGEEPPVPIVSIAVSLDAGTPDTFFFQADVDALEFLVQKLQFALLQAKSLQESITYKAGSGLKHG